MSSETAPCELLILKKDDFNDVLKATIKARWDEIRDAMLKFSYFDQWDDFTIRECCILSKIKSYEPNQVILGDGVGKSSQAMVYFVIEGTCSLIEHLFVYETVKRGVKSYKLYVMPEDEKESITDDPSQKKYVDALEDVEVEEYEDDYERDVEQLREHSFVQTEASKTSNEIEQTKSNTSQDRERRCTIDTIDTMDSGLDATSNIEHLYPTIDEIRKIGQRERKSVSEQHKKNRRDSKNCVDRLPSNVKLRFMQVCTFGEKSSFMNNKILEFRRVIALTPVKCILVPSYWLGQHNKGNVWTRVSQFLKWRVPTRDQVFRKYVSNRKWNEYKKKLVNDILRSKKFVNSTTIHDVPYSIRVKSEAD